MTRPYGVDPAHPNSDLVEQLVPLATELVCLVRDDGPEAIGELLDRVPDTRALAVVLAAMVPDNRSVRQLLAWVDDIDDQQVARGWSTGMLRRCHNAHILGARDPLTSAGHREWNRRRMEQRRAGTGRWAA